MKTLLSPCRFLWLCLAFNGLGAFAFADVSVPPVISDHMVLQHPNAVLWGKANANEKVVARFEGVSAEAVAREDGRWQVELRDLQPGMVGELTIQGSNTLTIHDVVVGDIWVASGQSNMTWTLSQIKSSPPEISASAVSKLRMFTVPRNIVAESEENVAGKWVVYSPEAVMKWSAVGFFFAKDLNAETGVPIGVISTSVGGTPAQAWTPREVLEGDPELKAAYLDTWQELLAQYPAEKEKYERALEHWPVVVEQAKKEGKPAPKKPTPPQGPGNNRTEPVGCYNGMIDGLTKTRIKGVIWYQGESNADKPNPYRKLLARMIDDWRKKWGQGEFPFLIVQLANYGSVRETLKDSLWADIREDQRIVAATTPNVALATAIDIGDPADIHPKNKQEVGRRLALVAKALVYGKPVIASGPDFQSAKFEENSVQVLYKPNTADGLTTRDGGPIKGFALAGEDGKFVKAEARTTDSGVIVSSPSISRPVSVRYAWESNPETNLVNAVGLPAVPFGAAR